MRGKVFTLAVPLLWLAASPESQAATITQNISGLVQTLGDFTPFDINALPFDPSIGILQDVTVELGRVSAHPRPPTILGRFRRRQI